ncbi:mediator of RNA polymerase II transcription subunit 17-like [Liolophura sinensis]|uniref:mediator of RNA polymerase II transcription subunit 17-like n=1 Tax=Liolophura sinensis TaxID=3198878 RepID=UPI00315960B2
MATTGVGVSVEAVIENQIQEVTLDGQEIYVTPLSMSENLTKLAQKIDFYKDESEDKGKPTSEGEKEVAEEKTLAKFQPSLWPWDSVRNKLKAAHSEMSVLWDVLNLANAKEKRYMVLDPVSQDATDTKASVQLLAKKKGLTLAASVLSSGSDRLKKSQAEISQNRQQTEFHMELLKLRQSWRLKKVGSAILGDLSYKSAGSRYYQGGTFEVKKSNKDPLDHSDSTKCSLEIILPSELEGVAYIHVEVKSVPESADVTSAILQVPSGIGGTMPNDYPWQPRLEAAQSVLFCKELFSQLAREAVQAKSAIPHMVIGNQIITNIFPGIQLSLVLCHYTDKDKKSAPASQKLEHNHVLEHSLHQLLREYHRKSSYFPMPHPATAILGMSKRRRLAGPEAAGKQDLVEMMESEGLLEQIIKQTKHTCLRQRVSRTIDELAKTVSDPQITAHWSCLNSSTEASVKVHIISVGYENVRTHLLVQIGVDTMEVATREGKTSHLSFEQQELKDLLLWQVSQHNISIAQTLAKLLGWQVLSYSNPCLGVGDMEKIGSASSIMMASPQGNRTIAIKCGPTTGLQVSIQFLPGQSELLIGGNNSVVKNPKWANLGVRFQKVLMDKVDGKNFANRLEVLMCCLVSSAKDQIPGLGS